MLQNTYIFQLFHSLTYSLFPFVSAKQCHYSYLPVFQDKIRQYLYNLSTTYGTNFLPWPLEGPIGRVADWDLSVVVLDSDHDVAFTERVGGKNDKRYVLPPGSG